MNGRCVVLLGQVFVEAREDLYRHGVLQSGHSALCRGNDPCPAGLAVIARRDILGEEDVHPVLEARAVCPPPQAG